MVMDEEQQKMLNELKEIKSIAYRQRTGNFPPQGDPLVALDLIERLSGWLIKVIEEEEVKGL